MSEHQQQRKTAAGLNTVIYSTGAACGVRLFQFVGLVWANQYLLRRVEATEYALFAVVAAIMVVGDIFKSGFFDKLTLALQHSEASRDPAHTTHIFTSTSLVLGAGAIILGATGSVTVMHLDALITIEPTLLDDAKAMLGLLVLHLSLGIFTAPAVLGLQLKNRHLTHHGLQFFCECVRFALLYYLFTYHGARALWLVFASFTASMTMMFAQMFITLRLIPAAEFKLKLFSLETGLRILGSGPWISLHGINKIISRTIPLILLNRFASPEQCGAYHLGCVPDRKVRDLMQQLTPPAKSLAEDDSQTVTSMTPLELFLRGGRYYMWVAMFIAPACLIFGKPFLTLYTGSQTYSDAATVFTLTLGLYPLIWASGMFSHIASSTGRIGAFNTSFLARQILATLLLLFFIGGLDMGAAGAAMALAIAELLATIGLMWPLALRLINGRWHQLLTATVIPGITPFFAALSACTAYGVAVPLDSWLSLLIGSLFSWGVYLSVLYWICLDERDHMLLAKCRKWLMGQKDVTLHAFKKSTATHPNQ